VFPLKRISVFTTQKKSRLTKEEKEEFLCTKSNGSVDISRFILTASFSSAPTT